MELRVFVYIRFGSRASSLSAFLTLETKSLSLNGFSPFPGRSVRSGVGSYFPHLLLKLRKIRGWRPGGGPCIQERGWGSRHLGHLRGSQRLIGCSLQDVLGLQPAEVASGKEMGGAISPRASPRSPCGGVSLRDKFSEEEMESPWLCGDPVQPTAMAAVLDASEISPRPSGVTSKSRAKLARAHHRGRGRQELVS